MKKTYKDVYVKLNDGRDMRFSDYVKMMQDMFDMYDFISEQELARIRKEEDEILAQR